MAKSPPHPQEKQIPCLRCDRAFLSRDSRSNRLCKPCLEWIAGSASDEDVYELTLERLNQR